MSGAKASRLARASLVSGVAVVTFLAANLGTHALGWVHRTNHCQYDDLAQISPITYRFYSVGSAYENATDDAASDWNSKAADGYFQENSIGWDPEMNVTDGNYVDDRWARNTGVCDPDGTYDGDETTTSFNTRTMGSLTANQKHIVAEHELGHAYGLGHVESGCHVMRTGDHKFTCGSVPSSDDVTGVNSLY